MLLPWSKPITLALSVDGIAVRVHKQLPRMLTAASAKLTSSELLLKAFADVMQDEAVQTNGKLLRLVLSNHFVRYTALPWQPEISSREDWLAIAQHDFCKRYGNVAEGWKISVSMNEFGHNIVAAAMDESLIDGLHEIALQSGCKLVAIEPFLMSVVSQISSDADKQWLLIAEPERVLLCEIFDKQWQRFSVISPPHQQEVEQALLLVHRSLGMVEADERPTQVLQCSAPSLLASDELRSEQVVFKALPSAVATNRLAPVALWMAGF